MKKSALALLSILFVVYGCQSNQQIENTFDESYIGESSDLIFTSPNFSAMHAPPLMSGFAYVETYEKASFCSQSSPKLIGKVTVTRSNKTQYSKLPAGDIVALVAYHAVGATGAGLKGGTYYSFNVEPESKYRISITESRPFVTSYTVAIEQIGDEAQKAVLAVQDRKNICSST